MLQETAFHKPSSLSERRWRRRAQPPRQSPEHVREVRAPGGDGDRAGNAGPTFLGCLGESEMLESAESLEIDEIFGAPGGGFGADEIVESEHSHSCPMAFDLGCSQRDIVVVAEARYLSEEVEIAFVGDERKVAASSCPSSRSSTTASSRSVGVMCWARSSRSKSTPGGSRSRTRYCHGSSTKNHIAIQRTPAVSERARRAIPRRIEGACVLRSASRDGGRVAVTPSPPVAHCAFTRRGTQAARIALRRAARAGAQDRARARAHRSAKTPHR